MDRGKNSSLFYFFFSFVSNGSLAYESTKRKKFRFLFAAFGKARSEESLRRNIKTLPRNLWRGLRLSRPFHPSQHMTRYTGGQSRWFSTPRFRIVVGCFGSLEPLVLPFKNRNIYLSKIKLSAPCQI